MKRENRVGIRDWFRFPLPCAGGRLCRWLKGFISRACAPKDEMKQILEQAEVFMKKVEGYNFIMSGGTDKTAYIGSPAPSALFNQPLPLAATNIILFDGICDALDIIDNAEIDEETAETNAVSAFAVIKERLAFALIASGLYDQSIIRRADGK